MDVMSTIDTPERSVAGPSRNFSVVIVGGGAPGITVAAQLLKRRRDLRIAVIEPSETHAYQPGWTLVGAGVFTRAETERREETVMPKGVTWLRQAAKAFMPEQNGVELADGSAVTYGYLVVCPGLQLDWGKIEGLTDALGTNGVCSNYVARYADYTWKCIQTFRGGNALFTQPPMPIKCVGAPQKIMYLAADHFQKHGRLLGADIEFCLAGNVLFGVPAFVPPLQEAVDRYGIKPSCKYTLKAIDGPAKTAAAVRPQAPVVVDGVLAAIDGKMSAARYDGYGSCPLTTAYGKVTPSFPLDPRVPRTSAWLLKTKFLPFMYWNLMLRGNKFDIEHRERPLAVAG